MLSRTPKTPSNLRQASSASTPKTEDGNSSAIENNMMNLSFRGSDIGGNNFSLKEQEKLVDEMKRENFDLKLKLNQMQEKLGKISNGNLEKAIEEKEQLSAKNEALMLELRQYRDLLEAARVEIEETNQRARRVSTIGEASEVSRLGRELEAANVQLAKLQAVNKKLEGQNKVFEEENKECVQKIRQLELDYSLCQRRLAEARNKIEVMEGEVTYLEEQNRLKDETVAKFRQEVYGGMSEFNVVTRQINDLQAALARMQAERDEIARERDNLRRAHDTAISRAAPMSPGGDLTDSPRSSMDGFELMLNKRVGAAEKAVRDLEKTTVLTKTEKEQLENNLRQLGEAVNTGIGSLYVLAKQIVDSTGLRKVLKQDMSSIPEAIRQLEEVCSVIVGQLSDVKEQNAALETLLQNTSDTLEKSEAEKLKMNNQLRHFDEEYRKALGVCEEKDKELEVIKEECKWLREKARRATDEDIPMLKNELKRVGDKLEAMNHQCGNLQNQLDAAGGENRELRKKLEEYQSLALKTTSEYESKKQTIANLLKEKENILAQLSKQEEAYTHLKQENDEMKNKLGHNSKVRSLVEEQFSSEITALHQHNSELKVGLNAANMAKVELQKRLENVQSLYAQADARLEQQGEAMNKLESEIAMYQRQCDMLRLEKNAAETELNDKLTTIARLETEIQRIKRGDFVGRKTTEGYEHLQAKIDQLNSLNQFLKEQADLKERQVRDLEERIRRQEEEVKRAFAEVDAKTAKLKKREALINQALKRLEAINYVKSGSPSKPSTASGSVNFTNKENEDLEF